MLRADLYPEAVLW